MELVLPCDHLFVCFANFPHLPPLFYQVFNLVFVEAGDLFKFMISRPCGVRAEIKNSKCTVQTLKQNELVKFNSCL
jgi:hypothetical protein